VQLGAQDAGTAEVRRFEHDVGGPVVHLGIDAAEHAGDDQRPLDVGDDEHLVVQRALHAVEGDDLLAGGRAARDELPAADLARVEGVQRLAPAEHHVVGHIDDVADGAHTGVREARLEPRRGVADRDAADDLRCVARAQVGSGDLDGDRPVGGNAAQHRRSGGRRRRQLEARRGRDLPGDAVDAEAVGPV
jgi:hypothetical protein